MNDNKLKSCPFCGGKSEKRGNFVIVYHVPNDCPIGDWNVIPWNSVQLIQWQTRSKDINS